MSMRNYAVSDMGLILYGKNRKLFLENLFKKYNKKKKQEGIEYDFDDIYDFMELMEGYDKKSTHEFEDLYLGDIQVVFTDLLSNEFYFNLYADELYEDSILIFRPNKELRYFHNEYNKPCQILEEFLNDQELMELMPEDLDITRAFGEYLGVYCG